MEFYRLGAEHPTGGGKEGVPQISKPWGWGSAVRWLGFWGEEESWRRWPRALNLSPTTLRSRRCGRGLRRGGTRGSSDTCSLLTSLEAPLVPRLAGGFEA